MPDLVVAGAGMAGLAAAAEARRLGADPLVVEKLSRPGGSMLLSSGVIWRHRDFDVFRAECAEGDERLQRLVFDRLDADLAWLESLGAPVVERGTGNPRTTGIRFDPRGLTDALVRAGGDVCVYRHHESTDATILATGGFQGSRELVAEHISPAAPLRLRANPWSVGDGLRMGLARGGSTSAGMDEFYGRNMPDADFDEL